jgi:hypothetical protein
MIVVSRESKSVNGQKACSRCSKPRDRKGQRYCSICHAAYMREWRAGQVTVLLTPEEWAGIQALRASINGPAS